MSYSISDNYSVLNNYNYENKSSFISALDWLSTPCRRVLGGRNVDVLSQTYEHEMTTARKVATIFISVLILPVAFISIASLIIKLATFPFLWEKKKVQVQTQQIWNTINQFKNAFESEQYDKAIQCYKQNPELAERSEIYDTLFKIINKKINKDASWQEVQNLLPLLTDDDAIELINHAVKVKLDDEIKKDCFSTQASDIMQFIHNSLSAANKEACYKRVFSGALQVDVKQDLLLNAFKMDLADQMLQSITQTKLSHAKNELESMYAKNNEMCLRYELFKKDQNHTDLFLLFNNADVMQKIGKAVQNIRTVSQLGRQSLNKLNALSAQNYTHPQAQWNDIGAEFKKFKNSLDSYADNADKEEKQYTQTIQDMFAAMVTFIDGSWKASSDEEIDKLGKEMDTVLNEKTKSIQSLFNDKPITYSSSNIEAIHTVLCLKKKVDLFGFTQKMRSFLNNFASEFFYKSFLGKKTDR